ncbi:hypothetical protein IWQ61_008170 [Dispira simplex]|nr:hypothetical protein IWQ61_008170 [Dispira simplex]
MASAFNVQSVVQAWRDVGLDTLQGQLDRQSLDIVDSQKRTLQSRKRLAEQTKEFRKWPDGRKLTDLRGLLKAYQQEIDQLTSHLKASEQAYLEVYRKVGQVADPVPYFEQLLVENEQLGQIELLESENKLLRKELSDTVRDLSKYKSQESQTTKAKVRVEQLEHQMEQLVKERVQEKERQIQQETDEVIQHLKDREMSLQKQLTHANQMLAQVQDSQNAIQAQALAHQENKDQDVIARLAEVDILQSELDRANHRIARLQSTQEALQRNLAQQGTQGNGPDGEQTAETIELQQNVVHLKQETLRLREALTTREQAVAKIPQLENQLQVKDDEIHRLQDRLETYQDYSELKRELQVLKAVEFSLSSWETGTSSVEVLSVDDSLEKLLLETNKRLQSDLTTCKNQLSQYRKAYDETVTNLRTITRHLEEKETLVRTLEEHLTQVQAASWDQSSTPGGAGEASIHSPGEFVTKKGTGGLLATTSPLARAASPALGRAPSGISLLAAGQDSNSHLSLTQILTGQRNRLKQQVNELESEIERYKDELGDLKTELTTLRQDNVKLYEKIRYMEVYQHNPGQFSNTTGLEHRKPHTTAEYRMPFDEREQGMVDDDPIPLTTLGADRHRGGSNYRQRVGPTSSVLSTVTRKYHQLYEAARNPFEIFQQRETMRQYRSLNAADKATLSIGRILLTNKLGRTFIFGYTIVVHVYITFLLYRTMTLQDTPCEQVKLGGI